jgi:Tfp pilus assembly protein PilZ
MSDKRKHLRLPVESRTFIELESPRVGHAGSGTVVLCKTLNVSRGGLLVVLEEEIPVGAILQIGVDLPGAGDTLYLAGEVRWCMPNEDTADDDHPWCAGFQILNADATDNQRWIEVMKKMEQ